MQWLNYHHLYYFYTIATEGSVTEATKKLRLAQSTLSAQLKQFEDTIGYQLFERKNRKLFLTDVGQKVYEYAHEIFSLGDELRTSIGAFEESLRVSLKVGIMDSIPKKLSRQLVAEANKGQDARVTIRKVSLGELLRMLNDHMIDLILSNANPPTDGKKSRFHARLVGELPVIFVGTPDRIDVRRGSPRALDGQPMIFPGENSPLRDEILHHLAIKQVQPKIVAEVDDVELQKMLALDGLGITALPLIAVEDELKSGALVRLSETPICHESLWLISGHRLVHNPIAKQLLESFRPR